VLILSLTYKLAIEQADSQMTPHMDWVRQGFEQGLFVASGRKIPRTGGVILAKGDRAAVEAYCAADPFVTHGIADYDIVEVAITTAIAGLEAMKQA